MCTANQPVLTSIGRDNSYSRRHNVEVAIAYIVYTRIGNTGHPYPCLGGAGPVTFQVLLPVLGVLETMVFQVEPLSRDSSIFTFALATRFVEFQVMV